MKTARLLVLAAPLLLLAPVACQAIVDLQSRTSDPLPTPGSCALPTNGNGKIRLVNLATEDGVPAVNDLADFCIRPSGTSDWGRPVFRDGGDSYTSTPDALCSKGLPYGQSTVPFNVPAGKIDVKAIVPGKTCNAQGATTSQLTDVSVGDAVNGGAPVVTIVRWGAYGTSEALAALPEEPKSAISSTSRSYYRVVNALSSMQSINFSLATGTTLPTTIVTPPLYPAPIKPGSVEAMGVTNGEGTTIDAQGYNHTLPEAFYYAASIATDQTNKAIALFQTSSSVAGDVATLYVIGDSSSNYYPLRGLYCEDKPPAAGGGQDAGAEGGGGALSGYSTNDLKLLAQCTPTALPSLSVDTFNVSLYGANAPYEQDRRTAIQNAIAARTSDIMCLLEVDDSTDRDAIIQKATMTGWFQYNYSIVTSETTPPSNPSDVHPTPSTPPCGGVDISSIVSCVEQKCSTAPDAGTGVLNGSTNCLSSGCPYPFGPVYYNHQYCFDCIVYYLTSLQEISSMQTNCTQDDNPPFAFVGQTPSMILSRYPLKNTQAYMLPATGFRRAVLKAQVQLEDQTVDFFCGQVSSPLIDADLPYTGYYGKDVMSKDGGSENGWEDEQDQQAQEAIKWMVDQADADKLPAIIAGDWHSSVACPTCSPVLSSLSPEVEGYLTQYSGKKGTVARADPPGYQRTCDYCASSSSVTPNSYNTGMYSYEWTPTYVYGFPKDPAVSETLWYTGNVVPIPEMSGMMAPIAEAYPRNVQLIRPH